MQLQDIYINLRRTSVLFFNGKIQDNLRAATGRALKGDLCAVNPGHMLYDGESETCAARSTGMALVHAVEAFEDVGLVLLRDADAGVGDNASHPAGTVFR